MLNYEDLPPRDEGRTQLSDQITHIEDITHIGPWAKYREDQTKITYVYNNSANDPRTPLRIDIEEDTVIRLSTTAYGETAFENTDGLSRLARKGFRKEDSALDWFHDNFEIRGNDSPNKTLHADRIEHLDKLDVADYTIAVATGRRARKNTPLPFYSFDNEEHNHDCPNCNATATSFQYNIGGAAGFDEAVYEWNPSLNRLYLKGTACPNCTHAKVTLHEQSPDNPGEPIHQKNSE